MGLALHNHACDNNRFPSAGTVGYQWSPSWKSGWGRAILPYLEGGEAIYNSSWQTYAISGLPANIDICPAKLGPRIYPQWRGGGWPAKMCDYAGNDIHDLGIFIPKEHGIRIDAITDGLSNTLAIGEKRINLAQAAVWRNSDDDFGVYAGYDMDCMRTTNVLPKSDYHGIVNNYTAPTIPPYTFSTDNGGVAFGGSHKNVFGVVFADGHAIMQSYNISAEVWKAIGTRAKGD